MTIIIGLGNPGEKYKNTRHNIGFQIIDKFTKRNNFPEFKLSKKFDSLISEDIFDNKKVIIIKPQTFMNKSGKAVKSLINFYKTARTVLVHPNFKETWCGLVVIHDDIDLPLGKIRIVKNRGAAGHKGVESIVNELKTKNFVRFRIGIKPINNEQRTANNLNVEKFVLQKFSKEERKIVKKIIKKTVEAIELTLKQGLEKAMSKYNRI